MARSQREKGKRGEREAAAMLAQAFPAARRNHSQAAGARDCDVSGTPFWVEVKVGKAPPIMPAMDQAIRDTDGRTPIVMSKRDRGEWLVTMRFGDFLRLLPTADQDRDRWGELSDDFKVEAA